MQLEMTLGDLLVNERHRSDLPSKGLGRCIFFKFQTLFASIFRATENKLILQKKNVIRCPILLIFFIIYFCLSFTLRTISYGCQIASCDPLNAKEMFLKDTHVWAL